MNAEELSSIPGGPIAGNTKRLFKRLGRPLRLQLGIYHQYPPIPVRPDPELLKEHKVGLEAGSTPGSPPLISIVTPSFNQGRWLQATIESVTNQRYPRLEYFVIDAGSTDNSVEILKSIGGLSGWVSEPDGGQADGINKGFARTSGDIMGWLNSDDLLMPGALHCVARWFKNHPDVDVVYGHRVIIDANGNEVGRWTLPRHRGAAFLWGDYIPQETMFWRRSLWERVGGKVDTEFQFAMDWELILRFHRAGAKFRRIPHTLGAFRTHPQQKSIAAIGSIGQREFERLRQPLGPIRRCLYRLDHKSYLAESVLHSWIWQSHTPGFHR
ncbi:MAG: glycosyltransferase [Phycisphaeraceae bacterium]|nr:glycosyltransferase [Phycisphaeraceae bacterium]